MASTRFPRVKTILRRPPVTVDAGVTAKEAAKMMHVSGVTSIIFHWGGQPFVFTAEHVLELAKRGNQAMDRTLHGLSIPPAPTVFKEDTVLDALERMDSAGSRYLILVGRTGETDGIVTYTDILNAIDPSLLINRKTIGELVAQQDLVAFTPDWILDDVLSHLTHTDDCIVVVENGELIGIITAKDAFRTIAAGLSLERTLDRYMTSPVVTIDASATILDALLLLKEHNIKRVVVVEEPQQIHGVLTQRQLIDHAYGYWTQLIRHNADELEEIASHLSAHTAQFKRESLTDALTEIGNRRQLDQSLDTQIRRVATRQAQSLSLIVLDIDHFKRVNDRFGHGAGDDLIKSVATAILRSVRQVDCVCRWGGDEFAVLAPDTALSDASRLASRICSAVHALTDPAGEGISVSVGVGEYCQDEDRTAFFERVDRALYRAKKSGRDRCEISTPDASIDLEGNGCGRSAAT